MVNLHVLLEEKQYKKLKKFSQREEVSLGTTVRYMTQLANWDFISEHIKADNESDTIRN